MWFTVRKIYPKLLLDHFDGKIIPGRILFQMFIITFHISNGFRSNKDHFRALTVVQTSSEIKYDILLQDFQDLSCKKSSLFGRQPALLQKLCCRAQAAMNIAVYKSLITKACLVWNNMVLYTCTNCISYRGSCCVHYTMCNGVLLLFTHIKAGYLPYLDKICSLMYIITGQN